MTRHGSTAERKIAYRTFTPLRPVVIALAIIGVGGCDHIERWVADPQPGMSGGGWLTNYNSMEDQVNLLTALDPKGYARQGFEAQRDWPTNKQPSTNMMGYTPAPEASKLVQWNELENGQQIDLAFRAFYDPRYGVEMQALRRNRLQEQLLAVSNVRCAVFKSILYEVRAKTNVFLGTLATATGVVGGIVTGAGASRALSGAAGIFSGTRAEFNQEMFQNLATQVIVEGIDVRRREVYDQMVRRGQDLDIESYSVEAAVKDAIFYHAQCNVVTGFQVAQDSIKTVADPGIDAANRVLAKLTATRALLQDRNLTPDEAAKLLTKSNSLLGLAGKPMAVLSEKVLPTTALAAVRLTVQTAIGEYKANTAKIVAEKSKGFEVKPDLKTIDAPADKAAAAALGHLKKCQQHAIDESSKVFLARLIAKMPAASPEKAAENESDKVQKELDAAKVTDDIRTVAKLVKLHVQNASELISNASADAVSVKKAIADAMTELGKETSAGVCK